MSLQAIMEEMASLLETELGDLVEKVEPRLDTEPSPPCIDIYPADPFGTNDGGFQTSLDSYTLTVRARVNTVDNDAGQDILLTLMDAAGTARIAAALEDDQTLNGQASGVSVTGPTGYRRYVGEGNRDYLGCEWTVTVLPVIT